MRIELFILLAVTASAAAGETGGQADLQKFVGSWKVDVAAIKDHARVKAKKEGLDDEEFEAEWSQYPPLLAKMEITFEGNGSYRVKSGKRTHTGKLTVSKNTFTMTAEKTKRDRVTRGTWTRTKTRLPRSKKLSEEQASMQGATWLARLVLVSRKGGK